MAWPTSNFPTSLDTDATMVDRISSNDIIANDINGAYDAIRHIEVKVGVDSSGVATTLDYLLKNASSSNPGHKHTLVNSATDVTATAAEVNLLDNTVAGTAVASRALALGADKNVDTLVIADNGLMLGAGAGTAVTATAAEINTACDGSTAKNSHTHIATPVAGTVLIVNAPTTQSTDSGSYVKLKEARVLVTGAYKVTFTLWADAECVPYGRVYKNGAAFGTQRTTAGTYAENLSFTANDLVQIYALLNSGVGFTYVNNFTIGILSLTDYADTVTD